MRFLRENGRTIFVAVVVAGLVGAPAIARVVADYAKNSDKVDGKHAVGARAPATKRRGKLVATNAQGFLPNNIIRKARDANKLDGLDSTAFRQKYARVLIVAKSGGDFATIQEAIDAATPNGPARWLVYVAPGTYNESVTMKPYVDVVGSGRGATTVSCECGEPMPNDGATVTLATSSDLKNLTVDNTGGDVYGVAIRGQSLDQSRLENLAVRASGGSSGNIAVSLQSAGVDLFRVDASSTGGSVLSTTARLYDSFVTWRGGELNSSGGDATSVEVRDTVATGFANVQLADLQASASGGDVGNRAIVVDAAVVELKNSIAQAGGPASVRGIDASGLATVSILRSHVAGQGPDGTAGIRAVDSSVFVNGSTVSGNSSLGNSYGIDFLPTTTGRDLEVSHSEITKADSGDGVALHSTIAAGNSTISIRNSRIAARAGADDTWAVSTERTGGNATMTIDASQLESVDELIENGTAWTTKIGATLLEGGTVTNAGILICVHSYNEDYAPVTSGCT